jgi:hypothetical protein
MSYTELLLSLLGGRWSVVTNRLGAEPAYPVVGLTNEEQALGNADHAREEVLCGSAARRLVGLIPGGIGRQDRGATPNTAASRSRLSGPAAALDKYEHAPHDVSTVRNSADPCTRIPEVAHDARHGYRDERLDAVRRLRSEG